MKTFLVERDVGATPLADLANVSDASLRAVAQMWDEGDRIRDLGSTYLPEAGLCLCLFEARNAEVVAAHGKSAHLPVRRIVDAVAFGREPSSVRS